MSVIVPIHPRSEKCVCVCLNKSVSGCDLGYVGGQLDSTEMKKDRDLSDVKNRTFNGSSCFYQGHFLISFLESGWNILFM